MWQLSDLSLGFIREKFEELPVKNSGVANMKFSLAGREHSLARLLTEETIFSLQEGILLKELLPVVSQTKMFEELGPLLEDLDFVVLFALQTLH